MILDIRELSSVADFFVIISANSDRHVKALVNEIDVQMKSRGETPLRKELDDDHNWCIIDYGCVIVHVFHFKTREFYKLENLWGDADRIEI